MNMVTNKRTMLFIMLLAVYNFFFWQEAFGLNAVIFTVLLTGSLLYLNPEGIKNKYVIVSLAAMFISCALVLIHNSAFSNFSLFITGITFTGFVHQKQVSSVFTAFSTAGLSFFMFPYNIIEGLKKSGNKYKVMRYVFKSFKLAVIPVIILIIFYSMYAYSNPLFNSYSETFLGTINDFLFNFFKYYPFERFAFIFLGLIIVMGILYNVNITAFKELDLKFLSFLKRDKLNKLVMKTGAQKYRPAIIQIGLLKPKNLSLISEFKTGIMLLVMVNLLLLCLNIIDIKFLWFGFNFADVTNIAYYVHNGTYMLIFSILLSMAILLYLFRGNINFYSRNSPLKFLAYLWIFQNAVMASSVALRNIYYMEYYYALSYKRIGVMIFLLLSFIGLVTMVLKIKDRRTTFNIFKINAAAVFVVMLLISVFNWDIEIAKFNLTNPKRESIDVEYLIDLSSDVLPLLAQNKDILERAYLYRSFGHQSGSTGLQEFMRKRKRFLTTYKSHTWLSWNYADYETYKYLANSESNEKNREEDPLNF